MVRGTKATLHGLSASQFQLLISVLLSPSACAEPALAVLLFAVCMKNPNDRRDNDKKINSEGQERKGLKLLLVSWIVSLIWFLTHHTSVHVANKTPGRKKGTVHHLPLLPRSSLSSSAVITIQQLPNTFFSFMKLMSPQINAEYMIFFPRFARHLILNFYFDVQTYVRMHSASSPFDELGFSIIFILLQDIFQRSGLSDSKKTVTFTASIMSNNFLSGVHFIT